MEKENLKKVEQTVRIEIEEDIFTTYRFYTFNIDKILPKSLKRIYVITKC